MRKSRKIIGVIISLADGSYQRKLIKGIQKRAYELNYDVAVFSTFIKEGSSEEWQFGEQNIYNVINYNLIDGIIIVPDTLKMEGLKEKLEAKIKRSFKGPVISVDLNMGDFDTIYSDDIPPVKAVVSHLIEKHNYTDIAFVTGDKDHPHAQKRLGAYCEALIEHGLPVHKDKIYYGDFWYTCGERVVSEMLDSGRPLPQAIACASDPMAITIIEELKKRGISVPKDVAVAGYDSNVAGMTYFPCITSAPLPAKIAGGKAVEHIHFKLTGKHLAKSEETEAEYRIGQSCGCGLSLMEEEFKLNRRWRDEDFEMGFNSSTNNMLESLLSESNLHNYLEILCKFAYQLGEIGHLSICLCRDWDALEACEGSSEECGEKYLRKGYTSDMHIAIERTMVADDSRVNTDRFFKLSEMVPSLYYERNYPTTFFFSPLHFNDRCFGYSVISYGDKIRSYDEDYRTWVRFVNNSLESLRRQRRLEVMYRKMRESAVIDTMTGIYSRNGFNLYADEIFRNALKNNKKLLVILGDLNSLKYINDTFGHLHGDAAIKAVAKSFESVCGQDKICFRIGGDEFIILSTGEYTDGEIDATLEVIRSILAEEEQKIDGPYPVTVSLGVYYDTVTGMSSIEVPISIADERMFRDKERLKAQRKN